MSEGNDSMNHHPRELCKCGHQNVQHGKSIHVHPGCDACGCDVFRPTGKR